ncbi:glycine zipper domain-containing protein [Gracilimonas sp.]|uniref:glycine zipper domain-containing protein n=1 Tax=Gracilimonas sp. TaxID=1974203 RepID=UPI003D0C71CE
MAASKKNSKTKRDIEETIYDTTEALQNKAEETYDVLLDRLKYERDGLERELKHEYRNARRYVRAHPEQGLGVAFVAGLLVGALLTRGGK